MKRKCVLWGLLVGVFLLVSCSLGEQRVVTIVTQPLGAEVYINERHAGKTALCATVPNRKELKIYLYKAGYYPLETGLVPSRGFWGSVLWPGMEEGLSLPEDDLFFTLQPLPKGV